MIIGISGKKGVGKSTLAKYLAEHYRLERFAFADSLKDLCHEWFGVPLGDRHGEPMEHQYRMVLQLVGKLFRGFRSGIFVERLEKSVRAKQGDDPALWDIVIDDVRYPNEADWIRHHHGLILRMEDETVTRHRDDLHESETALDFYQFDHIYCRLETSQPKDAQRFADDILEFWACMSDLYKARLEEQDE